MSNVIIVVLGNKIFFGDVRAKGLIEILKTGRERDPDTVNVGIAEPTRRLEVCQMLMNDLMV